MEVGLELLLNLYLGHLLGDFVLQPGKLVEAKRRGIAGLLTHVGIIGFSTAVILWADISAVWNIILLAMAAHLLIEVITIRARDSRRLSGLSVFIIDQGLHISSLVILVWLAGPFIDVENVRTFGIELGAPWVALACALIGVTFAGSILLFELVNVVGPIGRRRAILPYDAERILGMIERGAALLLASFGPGWLGASSPIVPSLILVGAFLPRTVYALGRSAEDRAYHMLHAVGGLIICASALGLIAIVTLTTGT